MSGVLVAHRRDDVDIERDRELVERAQQGDSGAFGDLYLRYFDRLCRFCVRRLGNVTEAEDAAQEAFAKAWRALDRFDGERRFYPWLSVIAGNVCTDIVRRRARSTPVEEPDLDRATAPVDGGVEDIVDRSEAALVQAALGRISPRHREVLKLRESYEWSYQRIAEYQGVEISTVETLLFRARRALRREFMMLAEAQGALGAALLVILRRVAARTGKVLHVGRLAEVANAGGAGGAAGGASTVPAVAAAAGGTGVGAGLSGALVAGIVATVVAAGALTAAAVTSVGSPAAHVAAGTAPTAAALSPAAAGAASPAAGSPGRTAGARPAGTSPLATSGAAAGASRHGSSPPGAAPAVTTPAIASPQLPRGPATTGLGAVGAAIGSTVGAVTGTAKTVTGTVTKVGSTVKKTLEKVKKLVPPLPPLPSAPSGTTGGLLGGLG